MKRTRTQGPETLPELLPELWGHVWHHCARRERWLVINRQWLAFGDEAVWRKTRESHHRSDRTKASLQLLGVLIHTGDLNSIRNTAQVLWTRRREQWASVQFCRGMRMLTGINAFCASFASNSWSAEWPIRCGQAHLLFLDMDGVYTLVNCDVYKHLARHARGNKVNRTTRLDTLWFGRNAPRYAISHILQLPTGAPVRYCERYEPKTIALDTTWWIFVVSGLPPHELARFLSRKHAMDWAKRRCGALLIESLKAPVAQ